MIYFNIFKCKIINANININTRLHIFFIKLSNHSIFIVIWMILKKLLLVLAFKCCKQMKHLDNNLQL